MKKKKNNTTTTTARGLIKKPKNATNFPSLTDGFGFLLFGAQKI